MTLLCPGCDKTFSTQKAARAHLRAVHVGRPFQCIHPGCQYAAKTKAVLKGHARTHAEERPYMCTHPECGYTTKSTSCIIMHARIHTDERPYQCAHPACGLSFRQWGTLYRHKMIHTEKTFLCPKPKCNYRATFQFDVDRHYKTHTGPFCVVCARYVVKAKEDLCGVCAMGSNFGSKERAVFKYLADRSALLSHWVRDTPLGCGTQRRPDGYLDLHVMIASASVLFVLEVDEHQHRYYNPQCELKRLEEIQERHGGALYLIRYNPDQPGGLEKPKLNALADRCIDILKEGYTDAVDAFGGMMIEYHGYSDKQVDKIQKTWFQSQGAVYSESV